MNNIIFLFVIAVISVGAGIAIGVLLSNLRAEKPTDSSVPKSKPNLIETARIVQDRKTGNLFLEVNGEVFRNPAEFTPSQRQQLTNQVQTLLNWLQPSPVVSNSQQTELPAMVSSSKTGTGPLASLSTESAPPAKIGPIDLLARSISPDARPVSRAPQSIVAQIDEILQGKLADSPLAGRGIRLMELPNKPLVVMVGLQQYEDVDAVPDPDIRDLIRQSVAEWEAMQTQG